MRFFYAHRADESPKETKEACVKLKRFLLGRTGKEYVRVVPGRADHNSYFRGDWEEWQASVVTRKDSTTSAPVYDAFVICGEFCGRASANILKHALAEGRTVFWWDGNCPGKLYAVVGVEDSDPEDWTSGWTIRVDRPVPKVGEQVPLPF